MAFAASAARGDLPSSGSSHPEEGPFTIPRPFAADDLRISRREALARGYDLAVRDCMRERNLPYLMPDARVRAAKSDVEWNPYGFVAPDTAEQIGYGLARAAAARPPDPNDEYRRSLDEPARAAWTKALIGSNDRMQQIAIMHKLTISADPDSCTHRALLRVYGTPTYVQLDYWAQDMANRVVAQTRADARFRAARSDWQSCMAAGGYALGPEVGAGQAYVRSLSQGGGVDPEREKPVARRDASCLVEVDAWRITRTAQASYEEAARRAHRRPFEVLERLRHQAVERVKDAK